MEDYLAATPIIDSDHERVIAFAEKFIEGVTEPRRQSVILYYAVRDGIWYDPYMPFYRPEHYRASTILSLKRGFCISKSSLLCALARACGIPARVGFATVRNHLVTKQYREFMGGSDLFVFHGFTELYLEGVWVKATPAFNIELCRKHRVLPLEFDGRSDSIFHPFNAENKKFMEYVDFHGVYADIPVDEIVAAWKKAYGDRRVSEWISDLEAKKPKRRFEEEDVLDL